KKENLKMPKVKRECEEVLRLLEGEEGNLDSSSPESMEVYRHPSKEIGSEQLREKKTEMTAVEVDGANHRLSVEPWRQMMPRKVNDRPSCTIVVCNKKVEFQFLNHRGTGWTVVQSTNRRLHQSFEEPDILSKC
ncbi:hypothetical protein AABB24_010570, partial [Solanum stoloniferum]